MLASWCLILYSMMILEWQLSKIISTYNFGKGVTVESRSDGVFAHDEADITYIHIHTYMGDIFDKCPIGCRAD